MKPLPWIAWGLAVLLLTASNHGYDVLANPAGWVLVLVGLRRLPVDAGARRLLVQVAVLAAAAATLTWPAPVVEWLEDTDESLVWVVSLPQVAFAVLLCGALATRARLSRDVRAARWLGLTRTLSLVAAVLPVLVFGGGLRTLDGATAATSVAAPVLLTVLLVAYRNRPWAAEARSGSPAGTGGAARTPGP